MLFDFARWNWIGSSVCLFVGHTNKVSQNRVLGVRRLYEEFPLEIREWADVLTKSLASKMIFWFQMLILNFLGVSGVGKSEFHISQAFSMLRKIVIQWTLLNLGTFVLVGANLETESHSKEDNLKHSLFESRSLDDYVAISCVLTELIACYMYVFVSKVMASDDMC